MDNGRFLADVTIPDDTEIGAGARFVKTWRVENTGDTHWGDGYHLVFTGGAALTADTRQPLPPTAPGETADVSVSLTAPRQPGTYRGDWRLQNADGRFFGELLFLEINVVRETEAPVPFAPELWRPTIFAITSVFESGTPAGDPAAYQNDDAGIISYGRHQATLASGTLHRVLTAYFQRSDSPTGQALQHEYAARVAQKDESLRHDARLRELLIRAAAEPEMTEAQDVVFARQFYQPAITEAQRHNITMPLGLACLYDTMVQGGLFSVLARVRQRLGGAIGDQGAAGVIGEETWLNTFLDEREARLLRLADAADMRGEFVQARALRASVFRVEELRKLLEADNLALTGEFTVRGQAVKGIV